MATTVVKYDPELTAKQDRKRTPAMNGHDNLIDIITTPTTKDHKLLERRARRLEKAYVTLTTPSNVPKEAEVSSVIMWMQKFMVAWVIVGGFAVLCLLIALVLLAVKLVKDEFRNVVRAW